MKLRDCVRILLINARQELLLMAIDDPNTTLLDKKPRGKYWFPVGGKVEAGETLTQAAYRELYEETTLTENEVKLGPIVWYEEFEMIVRGVHTLFRQHYMVIRTDNSNISSQNLLPSEQEVFQGYGWFNLEQISNSSEPIYPTELQEFLPELLEENYPDQIIKLGEMHKLTNA